MLSRLIWWPWLSFIQQLKQMEIDGGNNEIKDSQTIFPLKLAYIQIQQPKPGIHYCSTGNKSKVNKEKWKS